MSGQLPRTPFSGPGECSGASRMTEVLLFASCGRVLVLMRCEIKQKLVWIGWIGTEAKTADRTGVVTGPYAFAFPVCHYRPETHFFGWHTESLHRFQRHPRGKRFKVKRIVGATFRERLSWKDLALVNSAKSESNQSFCNQAYWAILDSERQR